MKNLEILVTLLVGVWGVMVMRQAFGAYADWRAWSYLRPRYRPAPRRVGMQEFAEFLELLALGLTAGLDFDRAWGAALDHAPCARIKDVFDAVESDLALGRDRQSTLDAAAARLVDERQRTALVLMGRAIAWGAPLEAFLLEQAHHLRAWEMMRLERRAQTAPLRMMLPIALLILPTLFLILFSPLWIAFARTGSLLF